MAQIGDQGRQVHGAWVEHVQLLEGLDGLRPHNRIRMVLEDGGRAEKRSSGHSDVGVVSLQFWTHGGDESRQKASQAGQHLD